MNNEEIQLNLRDDSSTKSIELLNWAFRLHILFFN